MPRYGFECAACGAFDVVRPMAQAGEPAACPTCGAPGRRSYTAPALRSLDPVLRGALDASARSAAAPDVVTSPPPRRRGPRYTTDPRHLRLPRP